MLSRNLNFRQAVSKKLKKIITVCVDAPFLFFDINLSLCCATIQTVSQLRVSGTVLMHVVLFHYVWRMYQIIL